MSPEQSSPPAGSGGSRTRPLRQLVLPGVRPSASWAAAASAIAATALAAGCAASPSGPAGSGKSAAGLSLVALMTDEDKRRWMAADALVAARRYCLAAIADRWEEIFADLFRR